MRSALSARKAPRASRRRPTLPRPCGRSTLGAHGLNFRVRYGTGCAPGARTAGSRAALFDRALGARVRAPWGPHSGGGTCVFSSPSAFRPRRLGPLGARGLGRLVRLGSTPRGACTCRLSNTWSSCGLTEGRAHLGAGFTLRCLQRLSRPDAATRLRHWLTTGAPEVRPSRSSRTRDSPPQPSCARGG